LGYGVVLLGCLEIVLGIWGIIIGWVRLFKISESIPSNDLLTSIQRYEAQNIRIWFIGTLGFLAFVAGILMLVALFLRNPGLSNTSTKLHLVLSMGILIYASIMFSFWIAVSNKALDLHNVTEEKRKEIRTQQGSPFAKDLPILSVFIITVLGFGCSIDMYRVFAPGSEPQHPNPVKSTTAQQQSVAFNQIQAQGSALQVSAAPPVETA
jgi:hypothetical protein